MNILLHGKHYSPERIERVRTILDVLDKHGFNIQASDVFEKETGLNLGNGSISVQNPLPKALDMILTLGGDGTILDVAPQASLGDIPVIGINLGRLGFLADIRPKEVEHAFAHILDKNYRIEKRSLVELSSDRELFGGLPFALNEIAVHKRDSSNMITIHAYVGGEYLNTYWGDGLIISTPTGSTAYSLSVGGPILTPGCNNFVFAPIAPHNLNVRPLVVPDKFEIRLTPDARDDRYLVSMDARNEVLDEPLELTITRAKKDLQLVQLPEKAFLGTLRDKLMWGKDLRTGDRQQSERS